MKFHTRFRTIQLLGLLLGIGLSFTSSYAQSQMEAYIQEGLESNLTLKQHQLTYESQVLALREAKGMFLPQLSFIANYTRAGGGRTLDFPIGDIINPVYTTLNSLTGENQFPTDLANVNEQLAPDNFQETKFRVVQPLYNSDLRFNRKINTTQVGLEGIRRDTYQQELIRDIKMAYYQYLQTEEVLAIYEETGKLLEEVLRVNQRLVENDKATYEVVSSAEYELSNWRKDRQAVIKDQQVARAYFNFLLNRPLEMTIQIDSALRSQSGVYSLTSLQEEGLSQRKELNQLDLVRVLNKQVVEMHRAAALPKVNLVLDVGFQGFGYTFDSRQDYWLGQVGLTWDIFQGKQRQARVAQAQLQVQHTNTQYAQLQQQIQLQIEEKYYQWKAVIEANEAATASLKHARDVFRITQRKYQEDQASWLSLTDARTKYTQARLSLAISTYDMLIQQADLEWAAGRDN